MITIVHGDMFDYPAEIRVNTVNCVGVMGRGLAYAFKTRYPRMFEWYKRLCAEGRIYPGRISVYRWQEEKDGPWQYVINLPTKRHWRDPSDINDVEASLKALREYLSNPEFEGFTVCMPPAGSGNGRLPWEVTRPLIEKYLSDLPMNILLFEPDSQLSAQRAP